jgi:hypothetical protein
MFVLLVLLVSLSSCFFGSILAFDLGQRCQLYNTSRWGFDHWFAIFAKRDNFGNKSLGILRAEEEHHRGFWKKPAISVFSFL